jgi:hypothetical protein
MQTVLAFFGSILNGVRAAVGLVLPVFANAADFRRWPPGVRVALGLAIVAALAVLAYLIQPRTPLENWLRDVDRDFKPFFLASVVLLVVLFSWLLYGLWLLLTRDEAVAEFPDVEAAWDEAVKRLDAAGMQVGDVPLYLVLGRPAAGMDAFFLAAGVKDIIRTPTAGQPPLRVYAWEEAVYVTCDGASAWGAFCTNLTDGGESDWSAGATEQTIDARATIGAGDPLLGLDPAVRAEMGNLLRASRERELTPDEAERLRYLAEQTAAPPPRKKMGLSDEVQDRSVRRLQFLCRLIRRDRRPWCPVNGVVVLIPWGATETDAGARAASGILSRDLNAARGTFQERYPTYAVVCDLETARGFAEFRSGFPADVLKQRIGQRIPLAPDVEPGAVAGVIASAASWIGLAVLPAWIHRFLQLEQSDPRMTPAGGSMHNRHLYLLMRAVFERGPRLAQMLARGFPPIAPASPDAAAGYPLLAGCYLAATGRDPRDQAFVPGIFQRVADGQNLVAWSPEARAEDTRMNRLTFLGYVGIVLLIAATVAALWFGQ